MNRLVITRREDKILSALWDGNRVIEFQAEDPDAGLRVGDIYVGRVAGYMKNLHAAFIEVRPGVNCFYTLAEDEKVRPGEEFPVQITREAVRTKEAVASRRISLAGRYMVLVTDSCTLSISNKITGEEKRRLREALQDLPERLENGFIIRTNAAGCEPGLLIREAEELTERRNRIRETAGHRPVYTRLMAGSPAYLAMIQDTGKNTVEEIVTDIPEICEEVSSYEESLPENDRIPVRLYTDESYELARLYRLEHWLEMALNRRVWLPSGGYLVIDPTEALTVIDVNTGKYDGKKKKEEAFLKTDLEAVEEIARQLRLRSLSGIILVDFIDLQEEDHRQELYSSLKKSLSRDSVKTVLVDITPLHLAEITRKKVRGTLAEQLRPKRSDDPDEN